MSDTAMTCAGGASEVRVLPADPFLSVRYHFGQLLGVQDFQDEQAYHRGRERLHAAWLHGQGVVWGLGVSAPAGDDDALIGEVQVEPGLAMDAAGNALYLDRRMCVDVARWYEEHRGGQGLEDVESEAEGGGTEAAFDAWVAVRLLACPTRPVPAMSEPCKGAASDTAFSRTVETVELTLVPGAPPDPGPWPYPRLRLLLGLRPPRHVGGGIAKEDREVLDALDHIAGLPEDERGPAALAAFRRFAALDVTERAPGGAEGDDPRFPVDGRPPVPLALVTGIRLTRASEDDPWTLEAADVDPTVRPALVATSTIQELTVGCCPGGAAATPAPGPGEGGDPAPDTPPAPPPAPGADAGGPRVDPDSVTVAGETVTFAVQGSLSKNSVAAAGVVVSAFDRNDGWVEVALESVDYDRGRSVVTVSLRAEPAGQLVRLIVRGTGPSPFLGTDMVPLAGAVGGPPGDQHDGNDFVFMTRTRS